jgi:hypothetical protein
MLGARRHNKKPVRETVRATGAFLCLAALCLVAAFAQNEAGRLVGKIIDPNGAAVVGATVTVRAADTGLAREVVTDLEGFYTVAALQPGVYEIGVRAAGFADRTQRVEVGVGSQKTVETQLSVTPLTGEETITPGSGGVEVKTQGHQLADPISGRQIRELPTVTRDPYELVNLSGNVTAVNTRNGVNASGTSADSPRGLSYSINGQRPNANNYLLDGGENIDVGTAGVGQHVPLEAVQEIQVLTNGFQADFGRALGGVINVATRSGGNTWRGSLFEFHRNRELSTNSFENNALGIRQGPLVANQFGYAVGGPLVEDRLFFFNSTELIRTRSREAQLSLVPTPQLLAASSAATRAAFAPFPLAVPINGRVFTVADVNSQLGIAAAAGNAFASLPGATPAFGLTQFAVNADQGAGLPQNSGLTLGRMDWNINDSSALYGRYAFEHRNYFGDTAAFSPFRGFSADRRERNHSAVVNWSNSLSPAWSYNTKASFNRINLIRPLAGVTGASPRLLLTNFGRSAIGGFPVALPGFQPFEAANNFNFTGPLNQTSLYQDFNLTARGHLMTFGGRYFYTQDNRAVSTFQNAAAVFGASVPQALSNLVLGQLSTFQAAVNPNGLTAGQTITLPASQPNFSRSVSSHDWAFYFNDNWRFHPRVNVNLGLRYDIFGVPRLRGGGDAFNFYLGQGANTAAGVQGGAFASAGTFRGSNRVTERDWNNLAPRVGVAVDLTGDGRTVLRGGYGVSYERFIGSPILSVFQNSANFAVINQTAGAVGTPTVALTASNFGPLGGATGGAVLPGFAVYGIDERIETPYVHQFTASLEREIFPNTVASVQYTGGLGRSLFTLSNVNRPGSALAFLGGAAAPGARLNPNFGPVFFLTNGGRSNNNALILDVASSTWRSIGLQLSARYRYGRALDNTSSLMGFGLNSLTANSLDPFNADNDYGPSDFDLRHRFVGSFNWEVPFERLTGDALRQVFGGWQVTGIFHARSGAAFTAFNCGSITSAEQPCPRVALSGAVDRDGLDDPTPVAGLPNRFIYLNLGGAVVNSPSAFPPFAAGTTTRNFFRGPNFWNADMGVSKRFQMTEEVSLQFRGEFFNAFNQANTFIRGNEVDVSAGGFVPAYRSGRRHVQLAVKLLF